MADPACTAAPEENSGAAARGDSGGGGQRDRLGNFLRFPGQAAQYGGGAFMIAYFVSLLLLGLPIGWAEWTMGRYAGRTWLQFQPGHSPLHRTRPRLEIRGRDRRADPGGDLYVLRLHRGVVPRVCVQFPPRLDAFRHGKEAGDYWGNFIGIGGNGSAVGFDLNHVGTYLLIVFVLNFVLIYRGIAKGIEWFCNLAMPLLIGIGLIVLIRVLTLGTPDPAQPERSVINGLGFMWNPQKVLVERNTGGAWKTERELVGESVIAEARVIASADPALRVVERTIWDQLKRPQLWLAAAGQIFFSLSVGFGVIITYSSYLRRKDDVVLSGLTATSANEFCEVSLGGLITLPAAVAFLGVMEVAGKGTFGLGFNVLPLVFAQMPAGQLFGFLFFFLLFLAAVTSSLQCFSRASLSWKRRLALAATARSRSSAS
jgi:SNF family Na+-dependent transporter